MNRTVEKCIVCAGKSGAPILGSLGGYNICQLCHTLGYRLTRDGGGRVRIISPSGNSEGAKHRADYIHSLHLDGCLDDDQPIKAPAPLFE